MRAFLVILAACAVSGFNAGAAPRTALVRPRAASPTMQFFNKKKGGDVYDDEGLTYDNSYDPQYAENGEVDLANVGGVLYLAFVPFLLFIGAYAFGGVNFFGYGNGGNF